MKALTMTLKSLGLALGILGLTYAFVAFGAMANSAEAAGLKCVPGGQYWVGVGGTGYCDHRQIAIDRVEGYYRANVLRRVGNPTRGCNWYRVLKAFGNTGSDASCPDHSPMSAEEAKERKKNWAGWGVVAQDLAREECRPGAGNARDWIKGCAKETKTCPGGGTILASQECPKPRAMLTCWDGSEIVARPEEWDNDAAQLDSECPRHTVRPAISISVNGGVDEGQAHTWTLHASQAPTRDVRVTVDFRGEGDDLGRSGIAMFGDVKKRGLGGGRGYVDRPGYGSVILSAGHTSVSFTGLGSLQDRRHTRDGKVTATVATGPGYTLGSPHTASAPVWDDDAPEPLTINLPTLTVREGGWSPIVAGVPASRPTLSGGGSVGGANLGVEGCVYGRITLTPASGGQPDSSDYRTWYIGDERWLCPSLRPQPYAQSGFIQATRDHHDDAGERLIIGWEQTGGDGTVTVNEGSITITNDGPLPGAWLAEFSHGVADATVDAVAGRIAAPRGGPDRRAAWADVSMGSFDADSVDGDTVHAQVGFEHAVDDWLIGVGIGWHSGTGTAMGDYSLDAYLGNVFPYASLRVGETDIWGTLGYGYGTLDMDRAGADLGASYTSWMLAGAGVRSDLMRRLVLVSDAYWTRIESGRARGYQAADADSYRLRLGLEASFALWRVDVRPEAFLRYDGGDADGGLGYELGASVRYEVYDGIALIADAAHDGDTTWSLGAEGQTAWGAPSASLTQDGEIDLGWRKDIGTASVGLTAGPQSGRVGLDASVKF